eukprot:434345-Lingulodinium_polyedra.AAC.1
MTTPMTTSVISLSLRASCHGHARQPALNRTGATAWLRALNAPRVDCRRPAVFNTRAHVDGPKTLALHVYFAEPC